MKNKTHLIDLPRGRTALILLTGFFCPLLPIGAAIAQSASPESIFADDFSVDSIQYSARSFSGVPDSGTARISGETMLLTAEQGDYPDYGNIFVSLTEASDTLLVTGSISSASVLPTADDSENASLAIEGNIYNTLSDGGPGGDGQFGEVQARFEFGIGGAGGSGHNFCLGAQTEEGYQPVNVFDGGSNNCTSFEGVVIEADVNYTAGFSIDREASTLTVILDENTRTVDIPGPVFDSGSDFYGFQLIHQGGQGAGGSAQANVQSVTTDSGTDTITAAHSIGRYQGFDIAENRSATISDEQLRLSAQANANDGAGIQVRLAEPTDYLEAVVQLSSDSDLAESGRHFAEMRADLYNDSMDGGFNGLEGEVAAFITFNRQSDGQRRIEYCLRRSDDVDGNENTGLLDDGRSCIDVPFLIELDVPYRIAIAFDRELASVTYSVNGFSHTQAINTGIFQSERQQMQIGNYADDQATTVLLIDDLRTAPASLTASELAAGLTVPAAFPEPLIAADLVAESTFDVPVFNELQTLDFVDDFSTPTMRYGFWNGRDRGDVAVSGSASQGYIEFQVRAVDSEDSNYAEFHVDGPTDSLSATVSLSSDSALPVDGDARANARIQGTFYNDTADSGVDGQLGDIYISLEISLRGDGRRRANLYIERRAADGSRDQQLEVFDLLGGGQDLIDSFVPELDTPHTLSLSIDRTTNTLAASIDDVVQTLSMPTEMFSPARAEKQVQISHRGSSGKAVGRIHVISTDNFTTDFSADPPVLGPYRPSFDAGYAGVDVEYEDGRVRMVVDSAIADGRGANVRARGDSEYVAASMSMSSETMRQEGTASVGIGGSFYNDIADGGVDGTTGNVFATVSLNMKADRDGTPIMVGEYCAFRSVTDGFDEIEELIAGDTEFCPRFSMPVITDTAYDMSIELDTARNVLVYTLADEVIEYAIPTDVYDQAGRFFGGARVRASDGALAVGYADNLSYSPNPVALAESVALLFGDTRESPVSESTSSSSGGGGCSIGSSNSDDPLLPLLALSAGLLIYRRSTRSRQKDTQGLFS